jgi:hypothetical protein
MKSSLYRPILSPVSLNTDVIHEPKKHLEISTRGIIFQSEDEIEAGTCLKATVSTVSMTGSLDFNIKVLKCQKIKDQSSFDVYANFFGITHELENEILEFISKT